LFELNGGNEIYDADGFPKNSKNSWGVLRRWQQWIFEAVSSEDPKMGAVENGVDRGHDDAAASLLRFIEIFDR